MQRVLVGKDKTLLKVHSQNKNTSIINSDFVLHFFGSHTWIYISVFSLCLDLPGHQLLSIQHTESDLLYLLSGHLDLPKILNLLFRVFSLSFITLGILYHTEYHSSTCHGI